jgi:hypothetical protein
MPDDFKIPSPQWPDEKRVIDALTKQIKSIRKSLSRASQTWPPMLGRLERK